MKLKPLNTKTKLIAPTSLVFVGFIAATVVTAALLYRDNVTSQTLYQMNETSRQILANYETYFDSVINVSDSILNRYSSLPNDDITIKDDMSDYFDSIMTIKPEIIDMAIYRYDNQSLIASSTGYVSSPVTSMTDWFEAASTNSLISNFSISPDGGGDEHRFVLSRFASFDKDSSKDAVIRVDYDFTKVVDTVSPVSLGDAGRFTIYDKTYNIVYSSSSEEIDNEIGIIKELVMGDKQVDFLGHKFNLYASTISKTSWRVAIFTNIDSLEDTVASFTWIVIGTGTALAVIFIIIIVLVANDITNPIKRLQKEMAEIASLQYDGTLQGDIKGSKEVVELNKSFNDMMGRIQELTKSVVEEKEEQRKTELKALQNQINPHFLYNTLDSIIALIETGKNEQAESMIVALSRFFRISISKGKTIIPLKMEIEHARNYLLIQKMRFGDAFSFEISCEDGLDKFYAVKLILQPIVENSIAHGLKEGESGHIFIRVYSEGDFIKLSVKDDGYGMTKEKVDELERSIKDKTDCKGVGLKNVYQRIRVYYGDKADLIIESEEDVGTTITIVIPKEGALNDGETE